MAFWNFCHDVLGIHVFYVVAIIVAVIMAISFAIQRGNQKKRDKQIEKILGGQQKAAPEANAKEG